MSEKITEYGEITYENGVYTVWNETYSEAIIESADVDVAFDALIKYGKTLRNETE